MNVKLRTFIADDASRSSLVEHVYDTTYEVIRKDIDSLVVLDDSIVRGTTLERSILTLLDKISPKKVVIVSSAPQIRYPDCYGIDMSKMGAFVAFRALMELLKDRNLEDKFPGEKAWTVTEGGFWRPDKYLELIHGFHYPENKVYLMQHSIMDEDENLIRYRFWTHYFDENTLIPELSEYGFENIESNNNILPSGDVWNGENISFYKMNKPLQID